MTTTSANSLVSLRGVSKQFSSQTDIFSGLFSRLGLQTRKTTYAVSEVDLHINKGEVLGLVGESGCGKSTLGRVIAGLYGPSQGEVHFNESINSKLAVQFIFQDPFASLNPRMKIGDIISEAPLAHKIISKQEQKDYIAEMLKQVGLDPRYQDRYPHQFSGGQRQRIGIARALAVKPELLICDEAVSALDVSIQAQILNLFMQLRETFDLTYLFISHDLGVIKHLSDRVAIMYLGRIVETADTDTIFNSANHPYTRALLEHAPALKQKKNHFTPIRGEIPSPFSPPPGCTFHPRCSEVQERCKVERPQLDEISAAHSSACHLNT